MKVSEFLKSFDNFGGSVQFNIGGRERFGTWPGLLLTGIAYVLIVSYAYVRFMTMWNYDDTLKQEASVTIQDKSNKVYTSDEAQFEVAFTIMRRSPTGLTFYRPEEISEYLSVTVVQTNVAYSEIINTDVEFGTKNIEIAPCEGELA